MFPGAHQRRVRRGRGARSRAHPDLGTRRRPDLVVGHRFVRGAGGGGGVRRRRARRRGHRARRHAARRVARRQRLSDRLGRGAVSKASGCARLPVRLRLRSLRCRSRMRSSRLPRSAAESNRCDRVRICNAAASAGPAPGVAESPTRLSADAVRAVGTASRSRAAPVAAVRRAIVASSSRPVERCARFLHTPSRHRRSTCAPRPAFGPTRARSRRLSAWRGESCSAASASASARSASTRAAALLVGRLFGRGLRAFAAVERVIQRQAVVALVDGVVVLQRVFGRGELLARVLIGAGGARGIDRALRLLHFFVGRIAARRRREHRREQSGQRATGMQTSHDDIASQV